MGQRKPQANKRKKKKRSTERRYSDGEASDYDGKSSSGADDEAKKSTSSSEEESTKKQPLQHQDSGVDMSDDNSMTTTKCNYSNRRSAKTKYDDSSAIEFKSDMIFDIEM